MKPTWNCLLVTDIPSPKAMVRNIKNRMYWEAILYHCTVDKLMCCYSWNNLYLVHTCLLYQINSNQLQSYS